MHNLKFLVSVETKAKNTIDSVIVFGFFVVFCFSAENCTPQCHNASQGHTCILGHSSRADVK